MTLKDFILNLILIALMFVAFIYASKIGMEAAIEHVAAQDAKMWSIAKGETHAR
jgi:hypothetical protein